MARIFCVAIYMAIEGIARLYIPNVIGRGI